jgi:two-component system, OmpR family, sensor kinase
LAINWLINKKHSIFFQISIFFVFILLIINVLIIAQFLLDNKAKRIIDEKRYFNAFRMILDSKMMNKNEDEIISLLETLNLKISDIHTDKLIDFKKEEKEEKDSPIEIYSFNNKKYIHFIDRSLPFRPRFFDDRSDLSNLPPPPKDFMHEFISPPKRLENIVLIDDFNETEFKYFWIFILFIIDILLIWFLIFLRKKLKPLFILKENMIKLSRGDFKLSMKTNGKDEISQVSNEFDNAIRQLRQLRESRNLFLRNIMHELKTPITKGKLISDTLEEDERREILIRVFQRLEYLLSEFSKIEELTSGKLNLLKSEFRVIDLIDQALDILLLDDSYIDINYNANPIINVDFDFLSIVLKNLIDNAIKYNTNGNPQLFIEENYIKIINKGNPLTKDINEYYKPFNNDYETAQSGLGLGLYISNNIIKLHNFDLEYEYKDDYHSFVIKFN